MTKANLIFWNNGSSNLIAIKRTHLVVFPCLSPRITHFTMEPWFFLMENDFQERKSWTGIVYIHPPSAVMFLHVFMSIVIYWKNGALTLILVIPVQSWTVHFSFSPFHVCNSLCSEKHVSHIFGVPTTCSAPVCNGWLYLVDQHSHVDSAFSELLPCPLPSFAGLPHPHPLPSQALSGMLGHCPLVILIPALPHFPQSSSHSRVLGWIFKEERKKKEGRLCCSQTYFLTPSWRYITLCYSVPPKYCYVVSIPLHSSIKEFRSHFLSVGWNQHGWREIRLISVNEQNKDAIHCISHKKEQLSGNSPR